MYATTQSTCNDCGGRGKVVKKQCPHCKGEKLIDYIGHYTLEIPRGAPEGFEVVFEGESDESPDWEPGDVVLRVRSRSEKGGWRRKEASLYWKETIGVDEVCILHEITNEFHSFINYTRHSWVSNATSPIWMVTSLR